MSGTERSYAALPDELAALGPRPGHGREVAEELRTVAETFAEVSDGKTASHALGVLAHLLDPDDRSEAGLAQGVRKR